MLVFCDDCGEMLGVQDHIRIRAEHFERAGHRGQRYVRADYVTEGADALTRRRRVLETVPFCGPMTREQDDAVHSVSEPVSCEFCGGTGYHPAGSDDPYDISFGTPCPVCEESR